MFTLDVTSPVYRIIVLSKRENKPEKSLNLQLQPTTRLDLVPQVFSSSSSQVAAQTEKYGKY